MDERRPTVDEIAARFAAEEPARNGHARNGTRPPSRPLPMPQQKQEAGPIDNPALAAELDRLLAETHEALVLAAARYITLCFPKGNVSLRGLKLQVQMESTRAIIPVGLYARRKIL
jgi:hypothetical protein